MVTMENRAKRRDERLDRLEDRVDGIDIGVARVESRLTDLEKQRGELRDDMTYMTSQSTKNNLVFTNIPEDNSSGSESSDVMKAKLRTHFQSVLMIA